MHKKLIAGIFVFFFFVCVVAACGNSVPSDMRPFPYPYQSMVALCSDIDGTTPREFEDYHKFLNTHDATEMGQGLGLDVADSFWMYMNNDGDEIMDRDGGSYEEVMTYYQGVSSKIKNGELIRYYLRCGWIDCIHSYGDFSRKDQNEKLFTRALAEQADAELRVWDLWPSVWINHGNAANIQNMETGKRRTYRQGARPESDAYHADITIPAGIKFIWFSDLDSTFCRNNMLYPVTLADGQKVWGFRRYTKHWNTYEIDRQLTDAHLDECIQKKRPAIVTQHLGGTALYQPFGTTARDALRRLAERQERGEILVVRTSRLLEYLRVRDHLVYEIVDSVVNILAIDDPQLGYDDTPAIDALRGMTFYVEDMDASVILIGGEFVSEDFLVRATDETGRATVGISWFEADTRNYIWGAAELPH